jgi:flagellar protein FliO/FliZ
MIVVIVAAYIATKYLSGKGRHMKSRHIRILDRMIMGRDKHIVLIEVGDKKLLIGITNQTINVLGDIDTQSLKEEPEKPAGTKQKGFASHLHDWMIHFKDAPANFDKARKQAKKTYSSAATEQEDYLSRMDDAMQRRKDHMSGRDKENQ